jgi:ferredoxin
MSARNVRNQAASRLPPPSHPRWTRRPAAAARFLCALAAVFLAPVVQAAPRFPQPQFETGHVVPVAGHPAVLQLLPPWADAVILAGVLLLAAWGILRRRSGRLVMGLALVSLAWFGFIRHGCICPVGATQNVAMTAFGAGGLPWLVAFLFGAPLVAAICFGRVFCSALCPLGAVQEVSIVRPLRVPRALDAVLRLMPLGLLAVAVLFAANDAGFPICATDPFVGLFRRSAPLPMLLAGAGVLLLGTVIARPYCRYFCPYGVLLGWCSRFAWKHATITPDECIRCKLCAQACPVDAIQPPRAPEAARHAPAARRQLLLLLLLAPVLVAAGGIAGRLAAPALAAFHPTVQQQVHVAAMAADPDERFLDAEAFRALGGDLRQLAVDAAMVRSRMVFGASLAGALLGLVLAWRLLALARLPVREFYTIDRSRCVSCTRCFAACPRHQAWRKRQRGEAPGAS